MFISFDQLTPDSRLWVYQANRALTDQESATIDTLLRPTLDGWAAHGHPLLASAQVVDGRFLLIGVDEAAGLPSGCSIDASVHTVQQVGQTLGVDFMDRAVTYLAADNTVRSLPLGSLKNAFAEGTLTPATTVFNTQIKTKADYLANWYLPADQTWLKRYCRPATV